MHSRVVSHSKCSLMGMFTELLQISIGHRAEFSHQPSDDEWCELFALSQRQALLGITFRAIEHLPLEQRPPRQLLLRWGIHAERIIERNKYLNGKVLEISQHLIDDGFPNVILKGQGIAQYYKDAGLELYRTPGDVDIWLDGSRKDIVNYARSKSSCCTMVYHHVTHPEIDGVEIELHITPSWMNSPYTNRVLQRYFDQQRMALFAARTADITTIPTPSLSFNRVYILVHIYRHLFHVGIGLRQLMDYYFVLLQGFTPEECHATMDIIRSLKMEHFAGAVMWIMQGVFCLDSRYLITRPNKSAGISLLNEIMHAGNLGIHDHSITRQMNESALKYGIRKVRRNMRFICAYPSETLWSPIFKVWHYIWRKIVNDN